MLILASNSPRRKEILTKYEYDFIVKSADVFEEVKPNESPLDYVKRMSYIKASAIYQNNLNDIILGLDTIVVLDDKIYGKPVDKNDAKTMLLELSGQTHYVYTSLTILSKDYQETHVQRADVTFRELTNDEIDQYLSDDEYKDKAGSYAIQGNGKTLIKYFEGSFYTVMGFPIELFNEIYLTKLAPKQILSN